MKASRRHRSNRKPLEAKYAIACAYCGLEKLVTRPYRKYCSLDCSRKMGRKVLDEAAAQGKDPAQTPAIQKLRREVGKARAASGELLGRALVKERRRLTTLTADDRETPPTDEATLASIERRPVVVAAKGTRPACVRFQVSGDEYAAAERRWNRPQTDREIITLAGHGCSVRVERGELLLRPGASYSGLKTPIKLVRGMHRTSTIVMAGGSGLVTLEAIQWCAAQKVAIFAIDRDGELTSIVSLPAVHNAALHRRQHRADPLKVAKAIVRAKIEAGMEARPMIAGELHGYIAKAERTKTMGELRLVEANAALPYWKAWRFTLKTAGRNFPDHWRDFTQRSSTPTVGSRKAVHPVNAMLNYGYALLAGQVQRALEAQGFDVSLGTLHADIEGRPSLVYDLIEPLRPVMDAQLLSWAQGQTWRRGDFLVDSEGVVRTHPAIARMLLSTSLVDEREIAEVARWYLGKCLSH